MGSAFYKAMRASTKRLGRPRGRSRQGGVAAVEFALLLPVMVALLTIMIFFARFFVHYSVAQKAAQSAAIYLATIPQQEMTNSVRKGDASKIAEQIAEIMVAELRPGGVEPITVDIECDSLKCVGPTAPKEVRVTVRLWMEDDYFYSITRGWIPDGGLPVAVGITVPYVGH